MRESEGHPMIQAADACLDVPEFIRSLKPYVPGKPISETKREFKLKKVIKLASNENPLGPSPKAIVAVRKALKTSHLYPDASAYDLKVALSRFLSIDSNELVIGNGSNEIIDLLVRTYARPGDAIVTHQAAFIAYRICAQIHGVQTHEAKLDADFNFSMDELFQLVEKNPKVKIVFLANPNNPTASRVPKKDLVHFLERIQGIAGRKVLVVLDYAYWEYVQVDDIADPIGLFRKYQNVVILRTFSKIYGLAGFRIGYAIAPEFIASHLEKVRMPFNVSSLALVAAKAALKDHGFLKRSLKVNQDGMADWLKFLKKENIPHKPSDGNFVLIHAPLGFHQDTPTLFNHCLKRGLILRPLLNYGIADYVRVSIGTAQENHFAFRVLRELKK